MQVTYQKRDGSIMQRLRSTTPPYRIGDSTSMGWKVLNIEYEYKGKYYSEFEYYKMIEKNKQLFVKKKQIKSIVFRELKTLLYYFIVIIMYNLIKILI